METNYDEYMGNAIDRKMKSRALNPELDRIASRAHVARVKEEKTYYCPDCDLSYARQSVLDDHLLTDKHKRKVKANRVGSNFKCTLCNLPFPRKGSLTRHRRESKLHARKLAEAKAKLAAAQSSS